MQSPFYCYYIFINVSGKNIKLCAEDIIMFEAAKNYVKVITTQKTYLTRAVMNDLEARLLPQVFCRVHRSYILNLRYVAEINKTFAVMEKGCVPVQTEYVNKILNQLPNLN